jgi:predicted NBD/HSP70 family sugar kinase
MIYVPSRMGQLNRRALLRRLQKLGVASRAELAKSLGMSQPTAGKIVDELISAEVLEEIEVAVASGAEPGSRGRPGRNLQLNHSRPQLLAIQLGLQETTVAALSLGLPAADEWQFSFALNKAEAAPARAWERQLRLAAKAIGSHGFLGVLLSTPGIVDESTNRVLFSPNLHWTEQVDLADIVRRVWNVPVLLVQEERALALGHHLVNPECEDFLLVDFGDGVGGAIIMDGKPLANPLPISGEIGHTPVLGNQRCCGCGATGCMETLVSLRGLLESFSAATRGKKKSWCQLREHIAAHGIEAWLAHSLDAAAVAIAGALNVLGLRRVVITGSLTELPPAVLAHLAQAVQNGSMWDKFGEVECVAAPRHRTAGLIAIGLDRLVVPDTYQPEVVSDNTNPIWRTNAARQNHRSLKIGHYRRRLVAGFSKAE